MSFFFPTQLERNEWVTFQLRCVSCALPSDTLRTKSIDTFIDGRVEGWTLLATCAAVLSLSPLSLKKSEVYAAFCGVVTQGRSTNSQLPANVLLAGCTFATTTTMMRMTVVSHEVQ